MTHKTPPHCGNFWRPEKEGYLVTQRNRQNKHKKLGNPFLLVGHI